MRKFSSLILALFLPLFLKAQWTQLTIPTTQDIKSSSFINDDEGWIGTVNSGSTVVIYHTADGGNSWNSDTITGASGGTSYLDFANSSIGYAVVNNFAFKTLDGGESWSELSMPGNVFYEPYFLNEDTGFINGDNFSIYKTLDGGDTWAAYNSVDGPLYSIDFLNDSVGAGSEYNGFVAGTTDGGQTWYEIDDGDIFSTFFAVSYNPDGSLYYTGVEDLLGQYTTLIKGEHGYSVDQNFDLYGIKWFDSTRCYAVGESGDVVNTEDGGITWTKFNLPELLGLSHKNLYAIDGFNEIYTFGAAGRGYKTSNACSDTANFNYVVTELSAQFNDLTPDATEWSWDFGDGTTSTEQNPLHAYSEDGDYHVCLVATHDTCIGIPDCKNVTICVSNNSASSAGTIDSTFGDNGFVINYPPAYYPNWESLAVQQDHKIVAVNFGYGGNVLRFNYDGSLDSSFGDSGIIELPIDFISEQLVLDSDNRILVVGSQNNFYEEVLRFNSNGTPDSSFGTNGQAIFGIAGVSDVPTMAIDTQGKVLFPDNYTKSGSSMHVVRLNSNGLPDSTFSNDGIADIPSLTLFFYNYEKGSMIVQPDDKPLIAATTNNPYDDFAIVRLNANGTMDSGFGNNGIATASFTTISPGDYATDIALQVDGKIVEVGAAGNQMGIARFNTDGTLDSTFGNSGEVMFQVDDLITIANAVAIQNDSKILVAGTAYNGGNHDKIALLRLNSDGSIDSTFGNDGYVRTSYECNETFGNDVAIDGNKIYIGGGTSETYSGYECLVRYNNDLCPNSEASFNYSSSNLLIQFTDQSSGAQSWSWNFGDGDSSSEQNPNHVYSAEGTYNVCLTVTDTCGSNSICKLITVCEQLNTDYVYNKNNLSVHFSNAVTTADSSYWDFGDGTTSTEHNPTHSYTAPGTYNACLYEFDVCGDLDTMCKEITVCEPLNINFSDFVNAYHVQFTDLSTAATEWNWDFGDGNFSTEQNPSHDYSATGSYSVCLIAGNNCLADTLCQNIGITGDTICNAYFTLIPDQNVQGLYYGYNLSQGNNLTYTWDWGDGTFSDGQLPDHTYADSGYYDICLTVHDTITSCTDTYCENYQILRPDSMNGIHEIIFVDYALGDGGSGISSPKIEVHRNPFSATSIIQLTLDESTYLSLALYDVNGSKIKSIAEGNFQAGTHDIILDRGSVCAGIYILRCATSNDLITRKLVVQ